MKEHSENTHHHPSVRTYILIALILGGITYIEFAIVEYDYAWLSSGAVLFWLYALSIIKFLLVIMFFMHLKFDSPMLTGLFTSGLIIGAGTLGALMLLFFFFQEDTATLEAQAGIVTATMEPTAPHDERVTPVAFDWGAGEQVYAANCTSCHQANGAGVPGAFPPLTVHAPAIVLTDGGRDYLLDVILYGLQGPIEVLGNAYNGVMPPWSQLSNEQIRDVSNYVIAAWGNAQLLPEGFEPYNVQEVEAQRGLNLSPTDVHARRQALDIQAVEEGLALEEATSEDVDIIDDQERTVGEPPPREDLQAAPAETTAVEGAGVAPAAATAASWNWQDLGAQVYSLNCASCHQPGGQGVPGAFPPLAGHTPDLYLAEGGRSFLMHVLLYGLQGPIEVEGQTYNGIMPAWAQLENEQIAAVINHILTAWGNDALLPEGWDDLTASEIDAARNLNLSMADVYDERQRLVFTAAPEAPAEEVAPAPEAAEDAVAAPADVPGEVAEGVYTLSLSPEQLQDSNALTLTLTDAEGNTYTTTLELPRGMQDVAVLAGPESAVAGAMTGAVAAEPLEEPAEVVAEPLEETPAEVVEAEPLAPVVEEPAEEEPVAAEPLEAEPVTEVPAEAAPTTPAEDLTHVLRLAIDDEADVLVITLEDDLGNRYLTTVPFTGALADVAVVTDDEAREAPLLSLSTDANNLNLLFEDEAGNRYLTTVPFVASLSNVALALGEEDVAPAVAGLVAPAEAERAPSARAYTLVLEQTEDSLVITLSDDAGNRYLTTAPFTGNLAEVTVATDDAPHRPPLLRLRSEDDSLTLRFENAQGDLYETSVAFAGTVGDLELALGEARLDPELAEEPVTEEPVAAEPLEPAEEVLAEEAPEVTESPFAPLESEVAEEPAPAIVAEPITREEAEEPEPAAVEEAEVVAEAEPEPVAEAPAEEEPVAEAPVTEPLEPAVAEEPEPEVTVLEPVQPVGAAVAALGEAEQPAPAPAAVAEAEAQFERLFFDWDWQETGAQVYSLNCATCHQASGQGIGRVFPPLAGHVPSLYHADGGRDYLVELVLYGLQGEIEILGRTYNNIMPPWPQLSDEQIAGVINHVLTEWGNDAELPEDWQPLMPREVAAARGQNLTPASMYEVRQALDIEPIVVEAPAEEALVEEESIPAEEAEEAVAEEAPLETLEAEMPVPAEEAEVTTPEAPAAPEVEEPAREEPVEEVPVEEEPPEEAPAEEVPAEEVPVIEEPVEEAPAEEEPEDAAPPQSLEPEEAIAVAAPLEPATLADAPAPRQGAVVSWQAVTPAPAAPAVSEPEPEPEPVAVAPAGLREGDVAQVEGGLEAGTLSATLPAGVQEAEAAWVAAGAPAAAEPVAEPVAEAPAEPEVAEPEAVAEAPAITEEPVAEEPVAEPPTVEEPAEEPVIEEPVAAEPAPTPTPAVVEEAAEETTMTESETEALLLRGQDVYNVACVRCHLSGGQGRGAIASLQDSEVVQGEVRRLVHVPVSGHGNMPSLIALSDYDMAAVLSYIRTHFDNDASLVSEEEVRQAGAQSAR